MGFQPIQGPLRIQGTFNPSAIALPEDYFSERDIFLDCRGGLTIKAGTMWGFNIRIYTVSHKPEDWGITVDRPVVIEPGAWICSDVILYNCRIGEGAVVALGAAVRSQDVPSYTMVAGNPARIIARFDHERKKWIYLEESEPLCGSYKSNPG